MRRLVVSTVLMVLGSHPGWAAARVLDLAGQPAPIRRHVENLASDDKARWREAQVRLAMAGAAALPELERNGPYRSEPGRTRVRQLLTLAMLTTVSGPDVERHPGLHALVAPDIARGFELARSSASAPGEVINVESAPQALLDLGGFAVPGILALRHGSRTSERLSAAVWLEKLEASVAAESLTFLTHDMTEIEVSGSDWMEIDTVANVARSAISRLARDGGFEDPLVRMDILTHNYDGTFDLINGMRQVCHSLDARTWDEWWKDVRPAWEAWWKLSGTAERPPDREAWLNWQREHEGFRLFHHRVPGHGTRLVITGPSGTRARIEADSLSLAEGPLPLSVVAATDDAFRAWWPGSRTLPLQVERALAITARLPDGTTWKNVIVLEYQDDMRIELLEPRSWRR